MAFFLFIFFVVLLRLTELAIAKRNEKWLLKNGAVEYGQKHYPFIVALHTLFILSLIGEYMRSSTASISWVFLVFFLILVMAKAWVIYSLGNFWNTKIFRVPGMAPVKKGPYKFTTHPNYVIVICEMATIPLVFHLYFTAITFSILNAIMISVRIKEENEVWKPPTEA